MPESQKFEVLRVLIPHEGRVHVKKVMGIASYDRKNFNFMIKKIKEEWDALLADKNDVPMAAATESATMDRICFKLRTNECTRKGCPFINKIMTDQEKRDQKYNNKKPAVKESINNSKINKNNNGEKKFKGKKDTRNKNSQGTNGMHNNMPLTREHQSKLGAGQAKPSANNPNRYSKKKIAILNFLIEQGSVGLIKNDNETGNFSIWNGGGMNSFTVNKNAMNSKGMSFNMFSPSQETSSSSSSDITNDSSIMRCPRKHLDEIEKRTQGDNSAFVLSDAMHIFTIGCLRFSDFVDLAPILTSILTSIFDLRLFHNTDLASIVDFLARHFLSSD